MRSTDFLPASPQRRRLLAALGALAGSAIAPGAMAAAERADPAQALYLAARKRDGRYEAAVIDGSGQDRAVIGLPRRGHSFAIDAPRQRAVAFGRQPGFFAQPFDLDAAAAGKTVGQTITPAPNRHFYGHGTFTPDGHLLLATENDYEEGRAVIGIYDASSGGDWRRIGEWSSAGIGAHEAVLLPDGRTLCVANGGLLTHPDYDKTPLNLADMRPSLAYIDVRHGDVLEQVTLPRQWHQLSIRHLVVAADGAVWFGCQHMGPAGEQPPLVGRHRRGHAPELFTGSAGTLPALKNYIGSVACDASGSIIATSSPVGGRTVFWDAASGRELGHVLLPDGCGVGGRAAQQGEFLLSSGHGELLAAQVPGSVGTDGTAAAEGQMTICPQSLRPARESLAWDNHLRRIERG